MDQSSKPDQSPPLPANTPLTTLDKLVLAIVVAGILAFAASQISQCVDSYANPATQSALQNLTRTFPGIMLCPFSVSNYFGTECPLWSQQAVLSLNLKGADSNTDFEYQSVFLANNNIDPISTLKRSPAACVNRNPDPRYDYGQGGGDPQALGYGDFTKSKVVKNSAASLLCSSQGCMSCLTFAPPNVECVVLDPSSFDANAERNKVDPMCNPMREVHANAVDSLYLGFHLTHQLQYGTYIDFGTYSYSGLIPQSGPTQTRFEDAPPNLSLKQILLKAQGSGASLNNSIFGGIVAVMYDAAKGIPSALDFDGVLLNAMSSEVLSSTVLLSTDCWNIEDGRKKCVQNVHPPVSGTVQTKFDNIYKTPADAVSSRLTTVTSQTMTPLQISPINQALSGRPGFITFSLALSFSSSDSVVTTSVVGLTILTTISIILSTAGTLWSSQSKIKEGIVLATTKIREYLKKRSATVGPS
jgi:hypothetical protein